MPYKPFLNSTTNPYHVTCRSINKDWFGVPMEWMWPYVEEQLYFTSRAFNLRIHGFVLMSNHFHLLVTSPDGNLSSAMNLFLSNVSKAVVEKSDRINHLWARRFKRCEIDSYHYFLNAYKYVYYNPVAAGICDRCEIYPYSTLPGLLGHKPLMVPVWQDKLLFGDTEAVLKWINTRPRKENLESMRKGLRRRTFKLPRMKQMKNPLADQLL